MMSGERALVRSSPLSQGRKRKASDLAMRRLCSEFGVNAAGCVASCIGGDNDALIDGSAAVLHDLFRILAQAGVQETEVWEEMTKRLRLGDLMFELNQPSPRAVQRTRRMWNVTSTKLP